MKIIRVIEVKNLLPEGETTKPQKGIVFETQVFNSPVSLSRSPVSNLEILEDLPSADYEINAKRGVINPKKDFQGAKMKLKYDYVPPSDLLFCEIDNEDGSFSRCYIDAERVSDKASLLHEIEKLQPLERYFEPKRRSDLEDK